MIQKIRFFPLLLLLFTSLVAQAGLFNNQPKFLPAEQAFVFSSQQNEQQLNLNWQIADGYYLYKKEIVISGIEPLTPQFPSAEHYHDEFFGDVEIFRNQLTVGVPLPANSAGQVEVRYQGCTKGFCYPPESVNITLGGQAGNSTPNIANSTPISTASNPITATKAEQEQLAEQLLSGRISIFWFLIFGLGLAFTPCVLPMLPLLSAIVIGKQNRPNSAKALWLSIIYVQGMALTYTLLGLIVVAIGLPFQIALQSPPVLIGLALLFTLLALSMFGLFEIRLPYRLQQKLDQLNQSQQGGSVLSVFMMGMVAGLVASPCTSAPLSGALLYVAQSGDLLTGGLALYLLALGMGIPLILITLFGNRILPKSGDWLLNVKTLFGFVMLALPVFLLARIFPQAESYLWSALAIAFLIWLYEKIGAHGLLRKSVKIILVLMLALVAKPFSDLIWQTPTQAQTEQHFTRITSLTELEQVLTASKGKKVMLDLYADWCVACKEFEKYTFPDSKVKAKLAQMVVLQIDMTKNSAENDALMKQYQILGLPTLLFFDENGNELTQKRVTGFLSSEPFLAWLNAL